MRELKADELTQVHGGLLGLLIKLLCPRPAPKVPKDTCGSPGYTKKPPKQTNGCYKPERPKKCNNIPV